MLSDSWEVARCLDVDSAVSGCRVSLCSLDQVRGLASAP